MTSFSFIIVVIKFVCGTCGTDNGNLKEQWNWQKLHTFLIICLKRNRNIHLISRYPALSDFLHLLVTFDGIDIGARTLGEFTLDYVVLRLHPFRPLLEKVWFLLYVFYQSIGTTVNLHTFLMKFNCINLFEESVLTLKYANSFGVLCKMLFKTVDVDKKQGNYNKLTISRWSGFLKK